MRVLKHRHGDAGFTLPEVMVAVVLVSMLGMMTVQIMQMAFRNEESARQHDAQYTSLLTAMTLLERDITQMSPVSLMSGQFLPVARGNSIQFLTLDSVTASVVAQRAEPVLVSWILKDGALWRSTTRADGTGSTTSTANVRLLGNVSEVSWRLIPLQGRDGEKYLPQAVEFNARFTDGNVLKRLLMTTGTVIPGETSAPKETGESDAGTQ